MSGGIRSSKLETKNRVFTIQGWIINGVPDYLILKNIQNQFKNGAGQYLGLRQAKNLLQKAYSLWEESEEATIEQKRALRIAELKQDIRSMKDIYKGTPQGMSVVNSIKKEISKLEALYPAKKHIIQGDKDNPVVIKNSEEREARITSLIAKAMKQD